MSVCAQKVASVIAASTIVTAATLYPVVSLTQDIARTRKVTQCMIMELNAAPYGISRLSAVGLDEIERKNNIDDADASRVAVADIHDSADHVQIHVDMHSAW